VKSQDRLAAPSIDRNVVALIFWVEFGLASYETYSSVFHFLLVFPNENDVDFVFLAASFRVEVENFLVHGFSPSVHDEF
jgi:hypothetical protein